MHKPVPWKLLLFVSLTSAAVGQSIKVGDQAPPITAVPLEATAPFPGWPALRGDFVIIDFWATWCGPCLPGLARIGDLQREFSGQPIRFVTVANDETDRVRSYFNDKHLSLQTYVDGDEHPTNTAYGIVGIPAIAIVDPQGKIAAVTPGENVSAAVLHKLISGEKVDLPPFEEPNDITWDRDQIAWQDGVQPTFEVLIKPIKVTGGGYFYPPGSNRISGDGSSVKAMIQAAWKTDTFHIEYHCPLLPTCTDMP